MRNWRTLIVGAMLCLQATPFLATAATQEAQSGPGGSTAPTASARSHTHSHSNSLKTRRHGHRRQRPHTLHSRRHRR